MNAHKKHDEDDFYMTLVVVLGCLIFGMWFQSWLHLMAADQPFDISMVYKLFGAR